MKAAVKNDSPVLVELEEDAEKTRAIQSQVCADVGRTASGVSMNELHYVGASVAFIRER